MGMGVSGGEEGARFGPSLMPGGPAEAYKRVEKILIAISAKHSSGAPCVTHIGERGAGNYVKMVHNGIEYGDMQLIAEAYDVLKLLGGFTNDELASTFDEWNKTKELKSFLIEITANIFKKKDKDGKTHLVDMVVDKTGNKGTGKWTCQDAAGQGVDVTTMNAALNARFMACMKTERQAASKLIQPMISDIPKLNDKEKAALKDKVKNALYASKICSYAQGLSLIKTKGAEQKWNLNLGKIASIWRGGCIIRADFLDDITDAFEKAPNLTNLLVDQAHFCKEVKSRQKEWREVVSKAVLAGIPVPAHAGSLAYFDAYRRDRLPANLTQAQT
eukprot:UN06616